MTTTTKTKAKAAPPFEVRRSAIHGNGCFATRALAAGDKLGEYKGERIDWPEALRRTEESDGPANHTFLFSLEDGNVIDGGCKGSDARWINHACDPNCEAQEEKGRVFIYALRDIARGEELNYDYALVYEDRHTKALKELFACRCGSPLCRGTMLAPKKRKSAKKKA
ncbi:MAG TPA: SET domain-containing protein-lysine N-methyltransferase [Burkholderiaceae bacterium]